MTDGAPMLFGHQVDTFSLAVGGLFMWLLWMTSVAIKAMGEARRRQHRPWRDL